MYTVLAAQPPAVCARAAARQTQTPSAHDAFASVGFDNSFNHEQFLKNMEVDVQAMSDTELIFDLKGVDAPIANAFRRVLLSEVPTMAIEIVAMLDNTSIIQDEVLSHRLGLVPIKVDPALFEMAAKREYEHEGVPQIEIDDEGNFGELDEKTTIVMTLDVTCAAVEGADQDAGPEEKYEHSSVYSGSLQWEPIGNQKERIRGGVAPVHKDILLAKLRPGQRIKARMLVEKGVGGTHAKWSPVATVSYKLHPDIQVSKTVQDDLAEELVAKCPMKVFDIEDLGNGHTGVNVANPRNCSMCRECIREPEWQDRVELMRIRDHFIFSVESTGVLPPADLFVQALEILQFKCDRIMNQLEQLEEKA